MRALQQSRDAGLEMPGGAVLLSPWVDYEEEHGSIRAFQHVDLVASRGVYEWAEPRIAAMCGGRQHQRSASPLHNDLSGLPPLFVAYSAHEVLADEDALLAARAAAAGVPVTVEVQPYLCHVYQIFFDFCPEGRKSMDKIVAWARERMGLTD